jgi:anthranilate phosphoribosyltransferase
MEEAALVRIIREIARGKHAVRELPRAEAQSLFAAMLEDTIPPLQLGAVLIAMRIKGESIEELAGFLDACEACYQHLAAPAGKVPLVIPAYNGARRLPNLTPLLALLVARAGVPVLVHGVADDPGRVTTLEIFAAMGMDAARDLAEAETQMASRGLALISIDSLAPPLARVLQLRRQLGVRSSGHTLVKMLQPFTTRSLRLVSVTHPEYLDRMRAFFTTTAGPALLLRGAEGEAVAHPRREPAIEWLDGGSAEVWRGVADSQPELPDDRDAQVTAAWITAALAGEHRVPAAIAHQAACCVRAAR